VLDLRRLSIFVTVVEQGSFTAAAQRLYMTQSAVSQQMSILERHAGVALLRRRARGVDVTEAGGLLATRAKALLADAVALEQELHRLATGDQEVRLGAFVSAGIEMLPQTFRAFTARCPDVRLVVRASSGEQVAMLRDGEIDVLLMWDYDFAPVAVDPTFLRIHLADDPMMVVLPRDHRLAGQDSVAVADLADDTWVTRAHRPLYGADPYEQMFRALGVTPRQQIATADYQSLQGLVAAGVGVSLAPLLSLVPHRPDVVVRPTAAPLFARRVSAWALPEVAKSSPVADLIDVLRTVAADMTAG
jgi:DNA-binding transcriptional LysR family regulator